ncbi:MAG: MFS transporter [Candidatus Curtissbacteria bacterium]
MEIFKNSQFLKLWGNQVLLQISFNMCNFTALLLINELTQSRFALAQFYAAMTLPAFFIGFFAGSIVDMINRKKLMLITDLALSLLFIVYAFSIHSVWAILAVAFIASSVAQFFTPAEAATIPLLVKGEELQQANSLFLFTQLGSVMLGYAIAGPVIQLFGGSNQGYQAAFIIAGALTAIGFFLRLSLHTIESARPEVIQKQIFMRTLILTRDVLSLTRRNHGISIPIILLTIMEFNIGMLAILFIGYVNQYLNLPATSTSYFLVIPLIAGLGLGVSIMGYIEKWWRKGHSVFLGVITFGLVLFSLGLSAQLLTGQPAGTTILRLLTMASATIIGIAAVFIAVHARTVLQKNTPETMMGRVFSLVTISASAVTPIPILLVALLTARLDVTTIFIIFGLILTAIGITLRPALQKHIK